MKILSLPNAQNDDDIAVELINWLANHFKIKVELLAGLIGSLRKDK